MSFFDEGDEPRTPRPRRPAGGVAAPPDPQTARIRQGVAAGVILLVLILLVVGVRGCLNSAKKRSLRDYNRDVSSLVQESDDQVSKPFFEALSGGGAARVSVVSTSPWISACGGGSLRPVANHTRASGHPAGHTWPLRDGERPSTSEPGALTIVVLRRG